MSYRQAKILLFFGLWSWSCLSANSPTLSLRVVTENFPPYNYQTDSGELTGVMNHIVQELLKRLQLRQKIEVLPWARAYKTAREQPNTLIYSIVRTPLREANFHWLASFFSLDINIYALPSAYQGKIEDLVQLQQHNIGIMRSSAHENYIRQHFYRGEYHVTTNISYLHLYQMQQLKRLDLIVAPSRLIHYFNQHQKTPMAKRPKAIFKLPFPYQKKLYIALSKNSSTEVQEKVKNSLKAMEDDGTITRILNSFQFPR